MKRLIQWFVENPIGANLLMVMILVGGGFNIFNLNKEVFPRIETNRINVSVFYPGAGPSEVEELVVERIEEAIDGIDGIKEIVATAKMSNADVTIEAVNGYDMQRLMNDIKNRIDAISTFPVDAERPIIREILGRTDVMSIAVYGDKDERTLKEVGNRLKDEFSMLPEISEVTIKGARDDEMAIEISEQQMRRYNLSFAQVVEAVRQKSLNLPAGTIKSLRGDIQLQTRGQAYSAEQFENIVVDQKEDGAKLYLKDVAIIKDGFTESDVVSRFNGQPAVFLDLYITENPDVVKASDAAKQYLASVQSTLPEGVKADVWFDWSKLFRGRLNLLLENSVSGLLLVFIVLMLFLRPLLAMWVCIGISVAFMGAIWLLPYFGVSLHMISLFAFLMVLGILVDDAIIVGESIYTSQQAGMKGNAAAASGAKTVGKPVLFAVISTIVFFSPMLSIPGAAGDMSYAIPVVVSLALFFSLIESLLILPSHLAHMKPENPETTVAWLRPFERWREGLSAWMMYFSDRIYKPFLQKILFHNSSVICFFVVLFGLSVAAFSGGWIERSFLPKVPSDLIRFEATMPEGTPFHELEGLLYKVERAIDEVKNAPDLIAVNEGDTFIENMSSNIVGVKVLVNIALKGGDERTVGAIAIENRWREIMGDLPETEEYVINSSINQVSKDINLRLSISDNDEAALESALALVREKLVLYPGVHELKDSLTEARTEIEVDLKPHAETLGLGLQTIAQQLRYGFYGAEAQRIPRGDEDVRVMIRYPRDERAEVSHLWDMRIRTLDNREIPLQTVADLSFVPGYTTIKRVDRRRSVTITAEMKEGVADPAEVIGDLLITNLPGWQATFPGFQLVIDGDMEEQAEFMQRVIPNFFLAMLFMYGLMAVAFKSYAQPLLILTAVPFGFMGAVAGHLIMGREISFLSMLGFIACAGVVVNDNLVLLDRINQLRKQGVAVYESVVQAGRDRFRPIILTSLTTFIGLTPILTETSTQARFLIPMVISLSFGVLCATVVTLILVPNLYLMGNRLSGVVTKTAQGKYQDVMPGFDESIDSNKAEPV